MPDPIATVIFKGAIIVKHSDGKWHYDFKVFQSLYEAKGYILRSIK